MMSSALAWAALPEDGLGLSESLCAWLDTAANTSTTQMTRKRPRILMIAVRLIALMLFVVVRMPWCAYVRYCKEHDDGR